GSVAAERTAFCAAGPGFLRVRLCSLQADSVAIMREGDPHVKDRPCGRSRAKPRLIGLAVSRGRFRGPNDVLLRTHLCPPIEQWGALFRNREALIWVDIWARFAVV